MSDRRSAAAEPDARHPDATGPDVSRDDIPYIPRPPVTGRTGPRPGY